MKKIQVGDKVHFLNEKGSGIVLSLVNENAMVEIEDGFEIQYPINQLVLIQRAEDRPSKKENTTPIIIEKKLIEEVQQLNYANKVYLVLQPDDVKQPLASPLKLYIYNFTSYTVTASILNKIGNDSVEPLLTISIKPNAYTFINKFLHSELDKINQLIIHSLFIPIGSNKLIDPRITPIQVGLVKLHKLNYFKKYEFSDQAIFIQELIDIENLKTFTPNINVTPDLIFQKENSNSIHKQSKKHAEVIIEEIDLHIEELIESTAGMESREIINIQLNVFKQQLDKAIINNNSKIIFIHGVGNGRLKAEIRGLLDLDGIAYQDASFAKFGYGATEVLLK